MDEPVDSRREGHEGPEFGQAGDHAGMDRSLGEGVLHRFPGIGQGRLQAQGDAVVGPVQPQEDGVDLLADGEDVLNLLHVPPADLGDGQKPLDAADIDECPEFLQ